MCQDHLPKGAVKFVVKCPSITQPQKHSPKKSQEEQELRQGGAQTVLPKLCAAKSLFVYQSG
jgi:hypothetical protein